MTTVTDEMVEAASEAYLIAWPGGQLGDALPVALHAALEAALAVMLAPDDDVDDPNYTIPLLCEPAFVTRGVPVGGTPTDAEFREAVESLIDASMGLGNVMAFPDDPEFEADDADAQSALDTARRTLLAMHAQARLAGLDDIRLDIHARGFNAGWREALEQLQESIIESSIKPENEFARGMQCADALVIQQIDTMLGGSHE